MQWGVAYETMNVDSVMHLYMYKLGGLSEGPTLRDPE